MSRYRMKCTRAGLVGAPDGATHVGGGSFRGASTTTRTPIAVVPGVLQLVGELYALCDAPGRDVRARRRLRRRGADSFDAFERGAHSPSSGDPLQDGYAFAGWLPATGVIHHSFAGPRHARTSEEKHLATAQ
ncbi:MAG: hypothetical protein AVDCRST_MAG53-1921 [uncultured Solirubrobacteraceae bacterium]|uniref:Uncharacterized protein n=1 Tax=uncultured Solirubrobacteraceae bacterium TaxID=1162706 RepID=A0A6J4SJU3_9ACTN|nr:MAG: hypothetical protein AVDCRST_MAG53-1921 [uncultured Solirubrobacteraceae bacterium]